MEPKMKALQYPIRSLFIGFIGLLVNTSLLAAPDTDWPKKPIVAILSFPAGGSTDVFARAVMAPLGEALGQSIVIDNKPGAGGMIGLQAAAKAAPDGYTIHFSDKSSHFSSAL